MSRRSPPITAAAFVATLTLVSASPARADYAVLRSGLRLHITGYQLSGERVRLTMEGGSVEVAADEILSVEREDVFPAPPVAPLPPPSGPYGQLIRDAAEKHGVDEKVIHHLIAVESNFNPRAVSRKRAQGLMQLLPQTAARYSVSNVFDPAQNIDGGTRYLKDLLARFHDSLPLALAAYNAGPEVVEHYGGVPPLRETQNYVRQITARLAKEKSTLAQQ
jgi:soluble lytic murein transglycosylase-like protein